MGDFTFWLGLILGIAVIAIGLLFVLRRRTMSARSPKASNWHLSERFVLAAGVVMMAAGALVIASQFL